MNLDYTSENLEIFNQEIENELLTEIVINDNLTNLGCIDLSACEENVNIDHHCDCGCDSLGDFFECQCDCTESEIFESLDLLSL